MTWGAIVRRVTAVPLLVGLAAGLLAGCGSGGDDDEPAAPSFVDAAQQVCTRADAQLAALTAPADREQAAVLLSKVAAIDAGRLAELEQLEPPDGATADAGRFLEEQERVLFATSRGSAALRAGESEEYAGFVEDAAEATRELRRRATALGLRTCAAYRNRVTAALGRLPLPPEPPVETTLPADETPTEETPSEETPSEESAGETPTEESVEETPDEEVPADEEADAPSAAAVA